MKYHEISKVDILQTFTTNIFYYFGNIKIKMLRKRKQLKE